MYKSQPLPNKYSRVNRPLIKGDLKFYFKQLNFGTSVA